MLFERDTLEDKIDEICDFILNECISPVVGVQVDAADIFLADINTYTLGENSLNDEIIQKIYEKYRLPSMDEDEFIPLMDACMPLATIALYVVLEGEYYD